MKEDSTTVGVGERSRMKLRGEPEGVDVGDRVGELLCEDMLALVPAMELQLESESVGSEYQKWGCRGAARSIELRDTSTPFILFIRCNLEPV